MSKSAHTEAQIKGAVYTYDNEGKMTSVGYPATFNTNSGPSTPGPTYTYSFDSMSRPTGLTDQSSTVDVSGVTYNAANQLLSINYFGTPETRQYNVLGQMTQLWASSTVYYNYYYPTGANNGKIASTYEALSGETIGYTYDALNRLATAAGSGWAETYGYDAFGSLTAKTPTAGTPPSLSQATNPANNQIVGQTYDANGNQLTAPGFTGTSTYDVENRVVAAPGVQYAYDSQNKRVWTATVDSSNNITGQTVNFYGVDGQKIGTYTLSIAYGTTNPFLDPPANLAVYFGGKRIATIQGGTTTTYWQDRLGSNRNSGSRYYPWGEDRSTPSNDQVRFATYTRDSATLLDYANNRYYSNANGRFMTPDPYAASGGQSDPQSWNRYAYTRGDPANRLDPEGTCDITTYSYSNGTFVVNCFDYDPDMSLTAIQLSFAMFCMSDPVCYSSHQGSVGGGAGNLTPQQLQQASALGTVSAALSAASSLQNIFTTADLECISGIETGLTWNPSVTASNGREGLFQFNQASWAYSGTSIPWNNGQSALNPYTAATVALALLVRDLGYGGTANPTPQAIQSAIDKFGENDGKYGQAVVNCANYLANGDFAGAMNTLQTYATWKASQ